MPLSSSVLKGLIVSDLTAQFSIVDSAALDKFAQAVADAVVSHITSAAVVPAGIAVQVNPATGTGATISPGTVL